MRRGIFLVWVAVVSSTALVEQSVLATAQHRTQGEELVTKSNPSAARLPMQKAHAHPAHHHKKHHEEDDDEDDDSDDKQVKKQDGRDNDTKSDEDGSFSEVDYVDEKNRHHHIKHAKNLRVVKVLKKHGKGSDDDDDDVVEHDKKKKKSKKHHKHKNDKEKKKKKKKNKKNKKKAREEGSQEDDSDTSVDTKNLTNPGWTIARFVQPFTTFFHQFSFTTDDAKEDSPLFKPFDGTNHPDFFTPSQGKPKPTLRSRKPSSAYEVDPITPDTKSLALMAKHNKAHKDKGKPSYTSTLMHTPVVWVAALLGLVAATVGLVLVVLQRNNSLTSSASVLSDEAVRDAEAANSTEVEDESADESEEEDCDTSSSGEEEDECDGQFENEVERITV